MADVNPPVDPTIAALLEQAWEDHRAGKFADAERAYRQILARDPKHHQVMHMLGVLSHQTGRDEEGVARLRRAIELAPNHSGYRNDLGRILRALGRGNEALAIIDSALAIDPKSAMSIVNRAFILCDLNRKDEAIDALRQAVTLSPDDLNAWLNLGLLSQDVGRLNEAAEAYAHALTLDPSHAAAHNNLGNTLASMGLVDEGIKQMRQAVAQCPERVMYHDNLLHLLHFDPAIDTKQLFDEHRAWAKRHADPHLAWIRPHQNDRSADRRLRIGYVSADFREHVVGWNLRPLFREHDRGRFEIVCYSNHQTSDSITQQLRSCVDAWRDVTTLSDEDLAEQVRRDHIDILVDLSMHSAGNRLLVFARKPAPVQITYLAYCSTSGMAQMDYRLSDPHLDPPGSNLTCYSERTIRLPDTYWCYEPGGPMPTPTPTPTPAAQLDARDREIVFGCLNSFSKVSNEAIAVWGKILNRVPRSKVIIHAQRNSWPERVWEHLVKHGVSRDRVAFVARQSWEEYVRQYESIDVALDPFPHNGGITTCDALWMGVPVVTFCGAKAVGRAGRSILANVGLPDLVANSVDEYVEIAVRLGNDLDRLRELRLTLRDRFERSPLRNAKRFARAVESAYREAWQKWCAASSS